MDNFIHIPGFILAREDLNLQAKVLYGLILGLSNKHGYCFATNEWMGKLLGITGNRISRYVSELRDKRLIIVEITKYENKETDEKGRSYGTVRHIYPYIPQETTNPLVVFNNPPLVENNKYIQKKNNKDTKGGMLNEGGCAPSCSPASFEEEGNPTSDLDPNLVAYFEKKAERKKKKVGDSPVKRKRETFTLSREDGLKISLIDNLDVESINMIIDKYKLSKEEVLETKQEYLDWVNGSSYDPKVWGKDMRIYVEKFCKRKASRPKKKQKPKDLFEELNEIYKAFD